MLWQLNWVVIGLVFRSVVNAVLVLLVLCKLFLQKLHGISLFGFHCIRNKLSFAKPWPNFCMKDEIVSLRDTGCCTSWREKKKQIVNVSSDQSRLVCCLKEHFFCVNCLLHDRFHGAHFHLFPIWLHCNFARPDGHDEVKRYFRLTAMHFHWPISGDLNRRLLG